MIRRKSAAHGPAVSLFPFLAVLLCTMGVLIVMLVMAVEASRDHAEVKQREHEVALAEQREKLLDDLDLQQFRKEQLEALRPALRDRLAEQRARRSHLEDETRRILERAVELERLWQEMESRLSGEDRAVAADGAEIARLEKEVQLHETRIEQMRSDLTGRPRLYSIIPARSATGTARRPIYIECRPDGIMVQPSGILLQTSEFTMPVLAGNPLDAAIMTTREHWNSLAISGDQGDPYPLLVVRPGGASSYAIARRAMASWDDEFGYELVEDSKSINWGAEDKELTRSLNQAIATALLRQQQMVALGRAKWLGDAAGPTSGGSAAGENAAIAGMTPGAGSGRGGVGGNEVVGIETASDGNSPGDARELPDSFANNELRGTTGTGSQENGSGISQNALANEGERESNLAGSMTAESANSGNGGEDGNLPAGSVSAADVSHLSPMAAHRGENWALPQRTEGATAYRRPIRVECRPDKFVIHDTDPTLPNRSVEASTTSDETVDALVNEIWKQIKNWGMAESGGYWKPVLRLVSPADSGIRAAELQRKLEGSGIEIERVWR
jgi:hypothetical protein